MAFNGSSRHSESIWLRHENKNVNTFGYKPYMKGKFISFVCFVCLFVVSFPFLFFSVVKLSPAVSAEGSRVQPRKHFYPCRREGGAQGVGGRFPQRTNRNTRRKFLSKRQKTFLSAAQNVFDHCQIPIVKIDFMFRHMFLL